MTEDQGARSILVWNGRVSRTRRISAEQPRLVRRLEHKQDVDDHEVSGENAVEKPRGEEDEDADKSDGGGMASTTTVASGSGRGASRDTRP